MIIILLKQNKNTNSRREIITIIIGKDNRKIILIIKIASIKEMV